MPRPPTLKIVEIFASIQGEGLRQGTPAVFIRLAGCNLRCRFCDTKTAWEGGTERSVGRIAAAAARLRKSFPAEWIVLTGGEPLLQDVAPLVRTLKAAGWKVQTETNGRFAGPLSVDWYTVSPKPPGFAVRPFFRSRAKEVKLVVSRELTAAAAARVRNAFPHRTPLLFQIDSSSPDSPRRALRLFRQAAKDGWPNIRLSVQLHKILNVP